jgi:beta-phosphoglucomutase
MRFKAIIFDLDGTIADTGVVWERVTYEFLIKRKIYLSDQDKKELRKQLHGLALAPACRLLKTAFNLEDTVEEMIHEKKTEALKSYQESILYIDGFVDFHRTVVSKGLASGIATNADDATLEAMKQALQLEKFFGHHIYNISHVNHRHKPDPALYEHVALQLNTPPELCIAIEDSAHGVAAAQGAGIFCIGINTAGQQQVAKADMVVDRYETIPLAELLKKLR